MKLNANRQVAGVLRGFDPFMNLVLDETVEKIKDGIVNNIGMVVCYSYIVFIVIISICKTLFKSFTGYKRR